MKKFGDKGTKDSGIRWTGRSTGRPDSRQGGVNIRRRLLHPDAELRTGGPGRVLRCRGCYPYVQDPNVVILLSQEAYTRYGRDLPPDTLAIIDPDLVKPDEAQNPAPLAIPATRMARELGRVMVANIITLGFLAAVSDLVSPQALKEAVLTSVPKGTEELNSKAFDQGHDHGLEHGRGSEGANG